MYVKSTCHVCSELLALDTGLIRYCFLIGCSINLQIRNPAFPRILMLCQIFFFFSRSFSSIYLLSRLQNIVLVPFVFRQHWLPLYLPIVGRFFQAVWLGNCQCKGETRSAISIFPSNFLIDSNFIFFPRPVHRQSSIGGGKGTSNSGGSFIQCCFVHR